ncbi:nitroreductase [Candidatus Woesearchaeota archaeon CG10_big_fil_rev_8_21_14_0_10_44_13]|nr:MAG: nitroreductase [Candidatus Woesearchaeota archaeon CG10_big_fil_rev_8_21_14_0_10_44_13]
MNETIRTIKSRRSIRGFNDKPISKDIIEEIIECGRYAPSAMNRQLWKFVVIDNKDAINDIRDSIIDDALKANPKVKERMKSMKDPLFYNSSLIIIVLGPKDDKLAYFDCAAAAQNMMLAARSLGVGSCPIGTGRLIINKKSLVDKLKIPDDYEIVITLTFGYSDAEPKAPERKRDNIILLG